MPQRSSTPAFKAGSAFSRGSSKGKYRQKPPGVKNSMGEWRKTVEVCQVLHGNIKKISNHPLTLTPGTSNIEAVANILSVEAFNGNQAVLLDKDGLKIPDTSATRSAEYWKSNTIIKAIMIDEYLEMDENSSLPAKSTKFRPEFDEDEFEARLRKVEQQLSPEVVNTTVDEAKQLLIHSIKENLICLICHEILNPYSCIILSCCENLGCCTSCIQEWKEVSPTCPHCRSELSETICQSMPFTKQIKSIIDILRREMGDSDD